MKFGPRNMLRDFAWFAAGAHEVAERMNVRD